MANRRSKIKINSDYNLDELFPEEAERLRIETLPEVEREELIFEKVTELQKKLDREYLLNNDGKDNKQKALDDIKSKRRNKFMERPKYTESPELGEISSEEYHKSKLRKGRIRDDESYSEGKQSESSVKIIEDDDSEKNKEEDTKVNEYDLEKVRISRLLFEKYYNHKLFNTTVKNCYVRLNLGGGSSSQSEGYMIAMIKEIIEVPEEPYKIGDKNYIKYFIAQHGQQEKRFSFLFVSNGQFERFEYEKWLNRLEKGNIQLPLKSFLHKKFEEIEKMKNYILSNEEIHKIIEEKRADKIRKRDPTLNITQELEFLKEKFLACQMKIYDIEDDILRIDDLISKSNSNTNIRNLRKRKDDLNSEMSTYKKQMEEVIDFINILSEMQEDKLKEKDEITLNERSYRINLKNLINQKEKDRKNRMFLNKKRVNEDDYAEANPYKRRECAPMNRFSKNLGPSFKVSSIKMTEAIEDANIGTPKEMYNKREKELAENRKLMKSFCEKINCLNEGKSSGAIKSFNDISICNSTISNQNKTLLGLFKTSELNLKEYIEIENKRLLDKHNISSIQEVPEFQFI